MADRVYSAQLVMTADVSQARAQLQSLQNNLNNLLNQGHNMSSLGLTKEIGEALSKVSDLKIALDQAMNINTGKLDLSKLTKSVNANNIHEYANALQSLGPTGTQSFLQLSRSILQAEMPLKRTQGLIGNLMTSMKNVVSWRISTGAFNAVLGALQSAYGYAQDLNESLNNIRIVTGQSSEQMAKFAKQANNSAKALSTTTTAYTDAALIFYQQGLNDKEVKERTDATIKLANVTGESAQAVSDYMTAVWNNFDDGSKSLEYYADVMTALGAATASSTDEIAAGLEKFAAVAETVGLSYEYATSALATVTSETRQSADVVGNAFKTLFARIQGLKLGETLEDGTSLNKYSEALMSVGINVKDQNGQLKDMDVILDEMGAKWDTLAKDQQTALAQTVAGVRQYTQLVALMDNYDEFKINLSVAEGAEGTLNEQQEIYEESWEAASKRVKASFEDIYDSIINDEFFIKLTDGLSKFLNVVGDTIDGLGGMKGVISAAGVLIFKYFGKDIFSFFANGAKKASMEAERLKQAANEAAQTMIQQTPTSNKFGSNVQKKLFEDEYNFQRKILAVQKELEAQGKSLTEEEKRKLGVMQEQLDVRSKELMEQAKSVDKARNASKNVTESMSTEERENLKEKSKHNKDGKKIGGQDYDKALAANTTNYIDKKKDVENKYAEASFGRSIVNNLNDNTAGLKNGDEKGLKQNIEYVNKLKQAMEEAGLGSEDLKKALEKIGASKNVKEFTANVEELEKQIKQLENEAADTGIELKKGFKAGEGTVQNLENAGKQRGAEEAEFIKGAAVYNQGQDQQDEDFGKLSGGAIEAADKFSALGMAISTCSMAISNLKGLFDIWNDTDMSFGEKLLATFTSIGSVLPMVAMTFSKYNKEALASVAASIKSALGLGGVGAGGAAAGAGGAAAAGGISAAGASLWSILWPIGLVIAAIAALIAIFKLFAFIIDSSSFTLEEQLGRAQQSVKELETELENAKTAAEELSSSFDNYNSIVSKLDSCTKGTKEYSDALLEANNAAIELLSQHPELYNIDGAIEKTSEGIRITEQGQAAVQEMADQRINTVNTALLDQKTNARSIQLKMDEEELLEKAHTGVYGTKGYIDPNADYYGYQILSTDEAGIKAFQSLEDKTSFTREEWDTAFAKATEGFSDSLKESIDTDKMFEWAEELRKSASELKTSLDNNSYQIKLENETAVRGALGEDVNYKSDLEISLMGAEYDRIQEEIEADILEGLKDPARSTDLQDVDKIAMINGKDYSGKELWNLYNEIMGTNHKLTNDSIQGGEEERFIEYVPGEGGEAQKISIESVASIISNEMALRQVSDINVTDLMSKLNNITANGSNIGEVVNEHIANGNLSQITEEQLNALKGDKESLTQDDIKKYFTDAGITSSTDKEAIAKAAGKSTWEEYINSFVNSANSMDFSTIFSDLITKGMKIPDGAFNNLGYDAQTKIAGALDKAFTVGGEDASNALLKILLNSGDKITEVLDFVSTYDWSIGNAEDFSNQLLQITGNSSAVANAVNNFGKQMDIAGSKIPISQISTFINKLTELMGLVKNLKVGDILSDDDVLKFQQLGLNIEDFAIKTYEGWKLISDIPVENLENEIEYSYKIGSQVYDQFTKKRFDIKNTSGEVVLENQDVYTAAETSHSKQNTVENLQSNADLINNITGSLNDEELEYLFGSIGNIDVINGLLAKDENGNYTGTWDQYQSMLEIIMDTFQQGKSGAFTENSFQTSSLYNKGSTEGFGAMTVDSDFWQKDKYGTEISDSGLEALIGYATDNEELAKSLEDYNKVIKTFGKNSTEGKEAAKKFYEEVRKIENNKAAQSIGEMIDELDNLTGSEYDQKIREIGEQVEQSFGVELSDDEVKEYLGDLENWAQGNGMSEGLINLFNSKNLDSTFSEAESQYGKFVNKINDLDTVKTIILECQGKSDFSSLTEDLFAAGEDAGAVAGILASIGETELNTEQFQQFTIALSMLQRALADPTHPMAQTWTDMANAKMESLGFSGTVPDVASKVKELYNEENTEVDSPYQPSGGGGGDSKDVQKDFNERRKKVYDDKISKLKEKMEGMEPGSPERLEAEEELNKLYEERAELLKNIGRLLKKEMEAEEKVFEGKHPEFDVKLDDNGAISNLADLYAQIDAEYEKILNEKSLEEANKYLKSIMEDMQPMLDLNDQIEENTSDEEEQEKERAQEELNRITEAIDWKIKQIDFQIKRLNYYQEKLLLQAHGNKQQIEAMLEGFQYQEQEMLKLFEKGQVIRDGIAELNAAKSQFPDNQQMFNEQILDYQSELIDLNLDILELRKDMEELVQNVLDLALDEIDIQNGRIEKYVSMLDHFNNIIDLSGRKMMDASLKTQIGAMKLDTLINKMSISKQTMEGLLEATNLAQEALEKRRADGDETSVKFWENQVEVLKRELEAAQETFLANWEETLQTASDIFDMRVELAVQTMSDALSPFSSMEVFSDIYSREKEIADQYLDDATKLYELNKLNRQLNLSIKDENDLLARSKLRDLQEEIYALQKAGVDMSQYDLEMLQKKYDLRLAEIALMEAQNSKTSMRLVRDAAGNWTYAYDADEQKIEDATQKYEDAMYEMTQKSNEYMNDMSQQLIDIQIEYMEALNNVDKNASDYQYQLIRIQEQYMERYRFTLSELKKSTEDLDLTMHDTLYGSQMDLWSFEDAQDRFTANSDLTLSELITNYKDWQAIVEKAMNVAGTSWDNFGTDMGGTLDSLEEHIQALCDEISKLVDVLMGYVAQSIGMVEEWQSKYSKQVDAELAKNEGVFEDDSLHQSRSSSGGGNSAKKDIDYSEAMLEVGKNGSITINGTTYKGEEGIEALGALRDAKLNNMGESKKNQIESTYGTTEAFKAAAKDGASSVNNYKDKYPVSGATGMYTGDWPNSEGMDGMGGKLAILHQKELVLNKSDTENILEAVELARKNQPQQISKKIDELVEAMQNQTSYTFNNLLTQVKLPLGPNPQELLQNVEIYADFPSVTDQNEIREAFNNLSNEASQYLGIKNRF